MTRNSISTDRRAAKMFGSLCSTCMLWDRSCSLQGVVRIAQLYWSEIHSNSITGLSVLDTELSKLDSCISEGWSISGSLARTLYLVSMGTKLLKMWLCTVGFSTFLVDVTWPSCHLEKLFPRAMVFQTLSFFLRSVCKTEMKWIPRQFSTQKFVLYYMHLKSRIHPPPSDCS